MPAGTPGAAGCLSGQCPSWCRKVIVQAVLAQVLQPQRAKAGHRDARARRDGPAPAAPALARRSPADDRVRAVIVVAEGTVKELGGCRLSHGQGGRFARLLEAGRLGGVPGRPVAALSAQW